MILGLDRIQKQIVTLILINILDHIQDYKRPLASCGCTPYFGQKNETVLLARSLDLKKTTMPHEAI